MTIYSINLSARPKQEIQEFAMILLPVSFLWFLTIKKTEYLRLVLLR